MRDKIIKRSFVPGDEWIYYKFYTGTKTADKILEEAIRPFIDELLSKGKIDQWFFIRYADPDKHLRVRLHYTNKNYIGIIVQTVFKHIREFVDQELIWKVQTDTYQREIERYGPSTIILSEKLFFYESNLILNILPLIKKPEGETQRWIFALLLIDNLLDGFRFNIENKLSLLQRLKDSYGKEFGMNKFLKGQIDDKYRSESNLIEQALNSLTQKDVVPANILVLLKGHSEIIRVIIDEIIALKTKEKLEIPIDNLIGSFIHMSLNRIFRSRQRLHEMVLYDFLYRYYKSNIARQKQKMILSY